MHNKTKGSLFHCDGVNLQMAFCFVLFCLNGCLLVGRKWVSHKEFCLASRDRTNIPTSLGQVYPNTTAAEIQTRRLACHQAATRTQADWNSVCPQRNPGVRTAPG